MTFQLDVYSLYISSSNIDYIIGGDGSCTCVIGFGNIKLQYYFKDNT